VKSTVVPQSTASAFGATSGWERTERPVPNWTGFHRQFRRAINSIKKNQPQMDANDRR
jgi:hypothetical protein